MTSHAEFAGHETLMLTAFRNRDTYLNTCGAWLFARRCLTFMCVPSVESTGASFRRTRRIRWPEADYPDSAPTWATYR